MTDPHDIVYRVNQADEIVYVNEAWDRFATANGGEGAHSAHVLHRSLWDFIADPTTHTLYRQILKRIRSGDTVRFNFRCDSPECRRLLEMYVYTGEDDTIEFRTHELLTERRDPPAILNGHATRSNSNLRACSWCNRIHVDDTWVEAEEAVERLHLFEQSPLPAMTHGICPDCYPAMSAKIHAERA